MKDNLHDAKYCFQVIYPLCAWILLKWKQFANNKSYSQMAVSQHDLCQVTGYEGILIGC